MTVKEKAEELINKMQLHSNCQDGAWMDRDLAKRCALISISFARETLCKHANKANGQDYIFRNEFDYLIYLKEEINKL